MRKLITTVWLVMLAITVMAQTDYKQWEVSYIKPKADKLDLFKKGMAAHNKKFHAADPYKANVSAIVTGPNSGTYAWIMGPTTWTQLDSRPGKGEHDIDWDKNVIANTESSGEPMYWQIDKDLQYTPASGTATFTKGRLRCYTLMPGEQDRFADAVRKVVEVYKKKNYPAAIAVYWRQGASTGPHVCTEITFEKWAYFDRANNLSKDFEEINGAGSWVRFLDELAIALDRTKTFDELSEYAADLSGGN